jgi:DNA-3-methyladenine glycosylase II
LTEPLAFDQEHCMQFEMTPSGPFRLAAENEFFGGWPLFEPGRASPAMAFPVEGWRSSALVVLRQADSGIIQGEIHGVREDEGAEQAWQQSLATLSLDIDASRWPAVGQRDATIGQLQAKYSFLRPVLFHSPYEAAAAFIIGHRISIQQGRNVRQNMAKEFGDKIEAAEAQFYAFPRPQVLAELTAVKGLSAQKIERLRRVAQAALEGRLDRRQLRAMPVEPALEQLRTLQGVGPFFAQGILYRGAGLVDEVSDDDVTAQAVQRAYQLPEPPDRQAVLARAEAWRPYRMWATVLLHAWLRREAGGPQRPGGRRPKGRPKAA